MKRLLHVILILLAAAALPAENQPTSFLLRHATIVTMVGATIEKGDLLIADGKIAAIGKDLSLPPAGREIDCSGLLVYPGFIDCFSRYGLIEIGAVTATVDAREMGRENPEMKAVWAINPHSVHFATGRINGTTAALVAPGGGVFSGQAALVKMTGWTLPEMAVNESVALLINFPVSPRPLGEGGGKAEEVKLDVTAKLVEKIKEFLNQARQYLALKKAAFADAALTPPPPNPKFDALAPVLAGTLPVIITVEKAHDIELAIRFVQDEKLRAIFRGCAQGFRVADKIKAAGIPVIIDSLYQDPVEPEDGYDAPFRNPAELVKAGVVVAFSSGDDPSAGKDLTYFAARAVAYGLDHQQALMALTINPARLLAVEDRMGSLETGKDADLFVTSGDPLDIRSQVKMMFINGQPVDLDNWWQQLVDRWQKRPE